MVAIETIATIGYILGARVDSWLGAVGATDCPSGMVCVEPLSSQQQALIGAAAAIVVYLIGSVIPGLKGAHVTLPPSGAPALSWGRAALTPVAVAGGGALVALFGDPLTLRDAIVWGIGWQSVLSALIAFGYSFGAQTH